MGEIELQPGWWFTTQRGTVYSARDYHAAHLSKSLWSRSPRRGERHPPPPRHLEWEYGLQKHVLTPDQKRIQAQQTEQWLTDFEAWFGGGKTHRVPAPPRRGSVITCWQKAETAFYEVGGQAREALAHLREVAVLAGGVGTDRLRWSAEEYAKLRRRNRNSLGEINRDQRSLIDAQAAMEKAVKDLAAASVANDAGAIASAESDKAEARAQLARVRGEPAHGGTEGKSALAAFCLAAAERFFVQAKVVTFVARFGPLILDFGAWCSDTEYGAFVSRHPGSAPRLSSYLLQLGHERFLWPKGWRKWATECYEFSGTVQPVHPVPAPVGFYVWAAYLLTALCEHPEWPGCQLFLANRLASLRLASDAIWFPELAQWTKPHQGRRLSARLCGELLDYLALFAAYRSVSVAGANLRAIMCPSCDTTFTTSDGRRRYCNRCSNRQTYNRVAQKRYRQRHKR